MTPSCSSAGWGATTGRSAGPSAILGHRFRALAFDARDAGQSDRADRPYTTADLADDVAGWLDSDRGEPGARLGPIVGGPGRPGTGASPPGAGEEPGSRVDTRRWRPVAQGRDRIVGVAAAAGRRSAHSPGRSFPGWSQPRFIASRPRSRGWSSSPSGTRGRKIPRRLPARQSRPPSTTREIGSGGFRFLAWSWSASSTR